MKTHLITTKITPEALDMLRFIAALTGESQYSILDRIIKQERDKATQEYNARNCEQIAREA